MVQTREHETVSIYPFTDDEVDQLMTNAAEAVLMWSTRDGWPVGVTHAFVWKEGKIWLSFAAHRHRTAAIKRDRRVSVNVSSQSYPADAKPDLPSGAMTFKGKAEFFDDAETKAWLYPALSKKVSPKNAEFEKFFHELLDTPLRTLIAVTPVKKIMYNAGMAGRHMAGTISEDELGEPLESDAVRMKKLRKQRGLDPA